MGVPNPVDSMDGVECSAVYIDRRVVQERWVYQSPTDSSNTSSSDASTFPDEPDSLRSDVEVLLGVCKRIYLCNVGPSLASKLAELSDDASTTCRPIFAFFDVDLSGEDAGLSRRKSGRGSWPEVSPPSPASLRRGFTFSSQSEGAHDLKLLSGLSADIQVQESPNLIVPVAVLRSSAQPPSSVPVDPQRNGAIPEFQQISKCLDAGAVDVLASPLSKARMQGLVVHAFRARKSALKEQSRFMSRKKLRKYSWVGVHDEQPYAYLREAMVSKLMKGICNPEEVIEEFQDQSELDVSPEREELIKEQIGNWNFTAHDFSDDELVLGASEILHHAFTMPNLEQWQLTPGELRTFLLACRASYNSFVLYHNFRHAIDVLQSVFCFLLHIGALPPYGSVTRDTDSKSPIASLLTPFDTLTLLISAIGHDVGHPGVNNFFLVKLNAPLAQLYNDNSVLEAFHCAAFSQILRRYWPSAFKDKQIRKLLISSILATDMGVHQKFMERLGSLQEKFYENGQTVDGWKPQDLDMYKTLLCGLLIKCADISNVARPWDVAEKWTKILQEEFANQGEMEKEVGMETALFGGPPELGNVYKLAIGQIGFMSIFALPLFEGVADILPDMRFTVEHIRNNQSRWHHLADLEKRKQILLDESGPDDVVSPCTQSPAVSLKGFKGLRAPLTTSGPDTPAKQSFPPNENSGRRETDYFGAVHSSVDSGTSRGSLNENTISPVVSPDTAGPSMDITGSPLPSQTPSRKSSNAVPDLTMVSIAGASPDRNRIRTDSGVSNGAADGHSSLDTNHSSRDPAVLAAVIFSNSRKEDDSQDHSSVRDSTGDITGERPSSSRNGPQNYRRHHANTNSSGRTSGPSNSQRNSCTRTHSISNYSNNMTPISPATNATSFLTVDDGEDKGFSQESSSRSDRESDRGDARPGSSNIDRESEGRPPQSSHTSHSQSDEMNKNHLMTPVKGNGNGYSRQSAHPPGSPKQDGNGQQWDGSSGGEQPSRKLLKRRSRLRLAFWKRKTHHSHHHELSGES
ncbi:high affinity cAMP phosphodiesterase [Aspergillus minisclerotigenes]|uniref:Phosphodiesterase n=1 Tax=Aspergillus minisclerotigenes TaxID=656917 RepID=A0A5N6J284_9EURO|nr:high affinity cAMP phosphodiesterase [Aspergillus minisclerotigenes]